MPRATPDARLLRQKFRRPPPSILELRLRDLSRLRAGRYGEVMPDCKDTRHLVKIIVQHLALMPATRPIKTIPSWIELFAPWMTAAETARILSETLDEPKYWKAHDLGWTLGLTDNDRRRLKITTIGCIDVSPQARAKRRKENRKIAMAEKRRQKGAKTRAEYLKEQAAKPKPWIELGISRAAYYRALRRGS